MSSSKVLKMGWKPQISLMEGLSMEYQSSLLIPMLKPKFFQKETL